MAASTGRAAALGWVDQRLIWADHDVALAKFTSILRHKPRPVTKSLPAEFNKNPELISAE
jgi:hypothetical protein